jgi:hypothetical protein
MSASEREDPKRGRGKGRMLSVIAEERRAKSDPQSEWVDKYGAADHYGVSVHQWSHRGGDRPPAHEDPKGWRWKRSDISAMAEMERLELWENWEQLRKDHGELVAWDTMLGLLAKRKAEIQLKATEALNLLANGEAA